MRAETPKVPRERKTYNVKWTASYRVPDELWALWEPLIPEHVNTHRFGGGRPRTPDRKCADGMYFVLRTGCQWKALDETDVCSGSVAHARFQEWEAAEVFERLWIAALEHYDALKGLDWDWLSMDGAMTKSPLGGEKKRQEPHRPWQAGHQTQLAD